MLKDNLLVGREEFWSLELELVLLGQPWPLPAVVVFIAEDIIQVYVFIDDK